MTSTIINPIQCERCGKHVLPGGVHTCTPPPIVASLEARVEELEAGVKAAAEALDEAAEDIADWGAYASDYFQEKHHLKDCVAAPKATAFNLRTLLALKG